MCRSFGLIILGRRIHSLNLYRGPGVAEPKMWHSAMKPGDSPAQPWWQTHPGCMSRNQLRKRNRAIARYRDYMNTGIAYRDGVAHSSSLEQVKSFETHTGEYQGTGNPQMFYIGDSDDEGCEVALQTDGVATNDVGVQTDIVASEYDWEVVEPQPERYSLQAGGGCKQMSESWRQLRQQDLRHQLRVRAGPNFFLDDKRGNEGILLDGHFGVKNCPWPPDSSYRWSVNFGTQYTYFVTEIHELEVWDTELEECKRTGNSTATARRNA